MHDLTDVDVDELFMRIAWSAALQPGGCLFVRWRETGYPAIRIAGERVLVHRLVYALIHGPIPDELIVDHHCHNLDLSCKGGDNCPHRRCIRPEHLRAVPQLDNILDGVLCRSSTARPRTVIPGVGWITTVDLAIALGRVPVGGDPNRAATLLGKELSLRTPELRSIHCRHPRGPKQRGFRIADLERYAPDVLAQVGKVGRVEGSWARWDG